MTRRVWRSCAGDRGLQAEFGDAGGLLTRSHPLSPTRWCPWTLLLTTVNNFPDTGIDDRPASPVVTTVSEVCAALGLKLPKEATSFYSTSASKPSFGEVALVAIVLLHSLKRDALEKVVGCFVTRTLHAGEELFKEGNDADSMYLVVAGRIEMRKVSKADAAGHTRSVRTVWQAGDEIGVGAIVDRAFTTTVAGRPRLHRHRRRDPLSSTRRRDAFHRAYGSTGLHAHRGDSFTYHGLRHGKALLVGSAWGGRRCSTPSSSCRRALSLQSSSRGFVLRGGVRGNGTVFVGTEQFEWSPGV